MEFLSLFFRCRFTKINKNNDKNRNQTSIADETDKIKRIADIDEFNTTSWKHTQFRQKTIRRHNKAVNLCRPKLDFSPNCIQFRHQKFFTALLAFHKLAFIASIFFSICSIIFIRWHWRLLCKVWTRLSRECHSSMMRCSGVLTMTVDLSIYQHVYR